MAAPVEALGQIASEGFAQGLIWTSAVSDKSNYVAKGSQDAEEKALHAAITQASEHTVEMISDASGDAADILEFQLAMLEDDTFEVSSHEKMATGALANTAWTTTLDDEIAGYLASDDEYFRARSTDLIDVKDRVLDALLGVKAEAIPDGAILLADDLAPSAFLSHDWLGGGIILKYGSATGHVAMLARQRGVPAVVGVKNFDVLRGTPVLLNAATGQIVANPDQATRQAFETAKEVFETQQDLAKAFAVKPGQTRDGTPIAIMVNIADPAETETIPIEHVDGVGLMRSEFLFGNSYGLPSENLQLAAYAKVLKWAGDKPVTIRTIDAGGDKPIAGLTVEEDNPFLGLRGIRLSLANPDIFAVQIRALLRAAVLGNLKVMLPMVAVPDELDSAIELFEREAEKLAEQGIAHAMPEIGIMVEVPSVAITPERFARAAFFSIGSNDLTQYVLAVSRDNGSLSYLARADNPAVLQLIGNVACYGREHGQAVSLCGDAASDPALVGALLGAGVETLSVAAARIGMIKAAIAEIDLA
ncbi:MAG: phosphoenolpyruvate--protein phosphotransferase [Hyphomicrobiales bacterium]|nr:MAG: phosphoenolpyruvate--protein phosphotransferase [Hyphomicrobiales bacterium]